MSEHIELHSKARGCTCKSGHPSEEFDWAEGMNSVIAFSQQENINKVLLNFRGVNIRASASDIVNLVKAWPENIIIASLIDDTNRENQTFVETACMNRGKMFRTFEDADAAMQWLKNS